MMTTEDIARVCHEANRALQEIQRADSGVPVADPWDEFHDQAVVIAGVELAIEGATPEELHEEWVAAKVADGWVYGEVKDVEAKTHPCIVDYDVLPAEQRTKDELFQHIVRALAGA